MAKKSSASSRRERLRRASLPARLPVRARTQTGSAQAGGAHIYDVTPEMAKQMRRLAAKPESGIDLSDIPEALDWSEATVGKFYRPIKKPVSLRIDADVLAWFKALGGKYQARMNAALREYMRRHRTGAGQKQE